MDDFLNKTQTAKLMEIANISDEKHKLITTLDIGRLPFFDVEIYFSDDIWDFGNYNPEKGPYKNKYDFSNIHYAYQKYVKKYVLELLINNRAISSIKKYLMYMKKICKFLCQNYIYDCTIITLKCVKEYNELLDIEYKSEGERDHNRRLFKKLLNYIEIQEKVDYSEARKLLSNNNSDLLRAQMESGKIPNLPHGMYDKIISLCLKEIYSDKFNITEKKEASAILLLSQVGMRIYELSIIKANKKKFEWCFNYTLKVPYLEFITTKTVRTKTHSQITKTFLTKIAELAYDTLEELTSNIRLRNSSEYIFIGDNCKNPIKGETLRGWIARFVVRNSRELKVINTQYEGFRILTMEEIKKSKLVKADYFNNLKSSDYVSIPNPHQFRVAVCNELINAGVEIGWIADQMNHLTFEMTMHYQRSNEDNAISKGVLEGVVTGEYNLIGEEANLLISKIDEFIQKNKYNIKTDLKEIVDELSSKVPIREKREGFCIKSAFGKKCKYNEFMCAFEMCPNHCTVYYFADITYKRFKEKLITIEYDKANNFISEANIETIKLKRIAKSFLIKELEELKIEMEKQGNQRIIEKHPQLEYITENIFDIMEEVKIWI